MPKYYAKQRSYDHLIYIYIYIYIYIEKKTKIPKMKVQNIADLVKIWLPLRLTITGKRVQYQNSLRIWVNNIDNLAEPRCRNASIMEPLWNNCKSRTTSKLTLKLKFKVVDDFAGFRQPDVPNCTSKTMLWIQSLWTSGKKSELLKVWLFKDVRVLVDKCQTYTRRKRLF